MRFSIRFETGDGQGKVRLGEIINGVETDETRRIRIRETA
jgi:hypothetical protein